MARQFYEAPLDLIEALFFGNENQGFVEYDIGAGTLAIGIGVPEWKPSRGGGCAALEVDDFDGGMSRLLESGCKFTLSRWRHETNGKPPVIYMPEKI